MSNFRDYHKNFVALSLNPISCRDRALPPLDSHENTCVHCAYASSQVKRSS